MLALDLLHLILYILSEMNVMLGNSVCLTKRNKMGYNSGSRAICVFEEFENSYQYIPFLVFLLVVILVLQISS